MEDPLLGLSNAQIPAVVIRGAYRPDHCQGLVRRFVDWGLIRDPEFDTEDHRTRVDIGTSLFKRGDDKEAFLHHAAATHELFEHLYSDFENPVDMVYRTLSELAAGKKVKVAQEPNGSRYGPAIFRVHYESHSYKPHFDHVTLREERTNYAVSRFEHQFAGILCFQNSTQMGLSAQTIIYRCLWTTDIQPHLDAGTFHEYAKEQSIGQCKIELSPGDLYFFNTRCIHEIPPIDGNDPRIVLAVFIGYSPDDKEIFVWS